jgi:hypothetical protein
MWKTTVAKDRKIDALKFEYVVCKMSKRYPLKYIHVSTMFLWMQISRHRFIILTVSRFGNCYCICVILIPHYG